MGLSTEEERNPMGLSTEEEWTIEVPEPEETPAWPSKEAVPA